MRYRLLEPLRQYAVGAVGAGRRNGHRLSQPHCFLLGDGRRAEPRLEGADQVIWQRRLQAEHDNLRAALRWMIGAREADASLRLAGALSRFWRLQGYLSEGRHWLEEALVQVRRFQPIAPRPF